MTQIAREKNRLGPLYPVKLHQMGEPTIHPRLVDIVRYAEREKGIPIELNTNCSLLTEELVDGLYDAGLTNFILDYQTPDAESFKTRKAKNKKLTFDIYLEKVRMAVERQIAKGARTHLELDVMNTKDSRDIRIVGSNSQADRVMLEWIAFARSLERKYGLAPKKHDLNFVDGGFRFLEHDADTGRYEILPGVDILWKALHTWGNVVRERLTAESRRVLPRPERAIRDSLGRHRDRLLHGLRGHSRDGERPPAINRGNLDRPQVEAHAPEDVGRRSRVEDLPRAARASKSRPDPNHRLAPPGITQRLRQGKAWRRGKACK